MENVINGNIVCKMSDGRISNISFKAIKEYVPDLTQEEVEGVWSKNFLLHKNRVLLFLHVMFYYSTSLLRCFLSDIFFCEAIQWVTFFFNFFNFSFGHWYHPPFSQNGQNAMDLIWNLVNFFHQRNLKIRIRKSNNVVNEKVWSLCKNTAQQ